MVPTSLNTITHLGGFGAGIALYGLLAAMSRRAARSGEGYSFATAILGLAWNAGALVVFGTEDLSETLAPTWISAVAYGALGFLPAVAVAATGHHRSQGLHRALVLSAYTLAALAAAWHVTAAITGNPVPVPGAMRLLTVGNLALIVGLLVAVPRSESGRRLATVALAAFAVMALHLSQHAESPESWIVALAGHHASLPLAFAILYQDYRFALADVFLKRALALMAVATLAGVVLSTVGLPLLDTPPGAGSARTVALLALLALWTATALVTPALLRAIDRFVDRVLLRRGTAGDVMGPLALQLRESEHAGDALEAGAGTLARALSARSADWQATDEAVADARVTLADRGTRAMVTVPTSEPPAYVLRVEQLAGGRRLLSEDRALLEAVATLVGRRVDTLRVAAERLARDLREESLQRLTSEAELRALRAQLHPHFLFNALTTLGYLMQAAPERARVTLYRLTSLLRAVLQRSTAELTTLGEELALVEDYLAIERERFEERLAVTIDVSGALADIRVPPLTLQTLVENAIKHGISPLARGGTLRIRAAIEGQALTLEVADTGRGTAQPAEGVPPESGVGLANLARRLERLYGTDAALRFVSAPHVGTTVAVRIPLGDLRRRGPARGWRAAS